MRSNLVAEFDRSRGWAVWGRSCVHWLNWRCGLDFRTAREKVRVAHALEELPIIREVFSRGELSYSKLRAITRIATDQTEGDLLVMARHGTHWVDGGETKLPNPRCQSLHLLATRLQSLGVRPSGYRGCRGVQLFLTRPAGLLSA